MEIFLGVLVAIFILYLAYSLVSNKIEDSFESKLRDRENQTKKEYDKKIEEAEERYKSLIEKANRENNELKSKLEAMRSRYAKFEEVAHTALNYHTADLFKDIGGINKFINAFGADFKITDLLDFSCEIRSGDNTYTTSLKECSCDAFKFGHGKPCKHMIFLALQYGFLSLNALDSKQIFSNLHDISVDFLHEKGEIEKQINRLKKTLDTKRQKGLKEIADERERKLRILAFEKEEGLKEIADERERVLKEIADEREKALKEIASEKEKEFKKITAEKEKLNKIKDNIEEREKILQETAQNYPSAAKILRHYSDELDNFRLSRLSIHAFKAKEIVRDIKREKRQIQFERDLYFAQLATYESLFPWLEEFKKVPIKDAMAYVADFVDTSSDEQEYFSDWLSPEDFARLSMSEKLQRKLDKWNKRQKTDWEAGIEYERYIGYLCEQEGYTVEYSGALNGLEDMGRDLVIEKGRSAVIIQCKRWKQDKQIHEKHIFQLFGTGILFGVQHPEKNVKTAFITTGTLSDNAQMCADKLNIEVVHRNMADYPLIKCNINNTTGEKIYHMPFDQQYDSTTIEMNKGECYAYTVKEAEEKGFRHAYRWRGQE